MPSPLGTGPTVVPWKQQPSPTVETFYPFLLISKMWGISVHVIFFCPCCFKKYNNKTLLLGKASLLETENNSKAWTELDSKEKHQEGERGKEKWTESQERTRPCRERASSWLVARGHEKSGPKEPAMLRVKNNPLPGLQRGVRKLDFWDNFLESDSS